MTSFERDTTPIINVSDVTMQRDETLILSDVTWSIERGQHWALLGANGSGKTSLLKCITGYEWPTSGRIEVLGNLFGETNLRDLRRHIGWVSSSLSWRMHEEETAVDVAVSGFEASIGRWREFTEDEYVNAAEALELVSASGIADRPWRVLSQGERQRALIARALVSHPSLLILDEPCAGLDPAAREEFLDDLQRLAHRPHSPTILFVTHHLEELRPFISHALVMKDGKVIAAGEVRHVLADAIVSDAFGRKCAVEKRGDTYLLNFVR